MINEVVLEDIVVNLEAPPQPVDPFDLYTRIDSPANPGNLYYYRLLTSPASNSAFIFRRISN
jgi:hypothetical protein